MEMYVIKIRRASTGEIYYLGDKTDIKPVYEFSIKTITDEMLEDYPAIRTQVVAFFSKNAALATKDDVRKSIDTHEPVNGEDVELVVVPFNFSQDEVHEIMNKPAKFMPVPSDDD